MIKLPRNKVGIIPVADPDESGGLHAYREGTIVDGIKMGKPVSLLIPEVAKERTDQGIVKYVGPACEYCFPGDHVIFSGWSGSAIKIEDPVSGEVERLLILPEDFIVAKLHDLERLVVPGLYFLGKDGTPFEATYEMALDLVARAVKRERDAHPGAIRISGNQRPKLEEYNKLRGG